MSDVLKARKGDRHWLQHALAIVRACPVVIRQQMGHSSSDMTDHYTNTLSSEQVRAAFVSKFGRKIDALENDGKRETVSTVA